MRFCRQIFEKQGIDRAFQANMQFADLAFAACKEPDTTEAQAFEKPRDVFLISRQAIESLGEYYYEFDSH